MTNLFNNNSTDLSSVAEQLCRIEHKLDLVIEYMAMKDGEFPLRKMLDERNIDPVTQEQVTYFMDLFKRHVVRNTSLGTGLMGPFAGLFPPIPTPTPTGSTNNGNGNEG
jgi:hypothetical protein